MFTLTKACYWEGIHLSGQRVSGKQLTSQFDILRAQLNREGILVTKLKPTWSIVLTSAHLSIQEISNFSRQLAHLLGSGFPLLTALDLLLSQHFSNFLMQSLLLGLKTSLENGIKFSTALREYPHYFNALYCHLISVGEKCGNLVDPLLQLSNYQEKLLVIRGNIYKALYYPIGLLGIFIFVIIFLIVLVIPQFEHLFTTVGADLPSLTRALINIAHGLQAYGFYILFAGLSLTILVILFRDRLTRWNDFGYQLIFKLPWIGAIMQKASLARFARTLSATLAAGLPLLEALSATKEAVQYTVYRVAISKAEQAVIAGIPLEKALERAQCFSPLLIQTIVVSQLSGQLDQNLARLAAFFETNVHDSVSTMVRFLEPILLLVLGIVIGVFMLALYWPIFELGNVATIL